MARIPRYQSTGIQPIAPKPIREVSTGRSSLIVDSLSQMQRFIDTNVQQKRAEIERFRYQEQQLMQQQTREAYQKKYDVAQEKGLRDVADFGSDTILQQVEDAGGIANIQSISERAAYEEASRLASLSILTEGQLEIDRIYNEALTDPNVTYEQANFQALAAIDGFSASLSNVHARYAGETRVRLENYASGKDSELLRATAQEQRSATIFNTTLGIDNSLTAVEASVRRTGIEQSSEIIEQTRDQINEAYEARLISERDRDAYLNDITNRTAEGNVYNQVSSLLSNPQISEEQVEDYLEETRVRGNIGNLTTEQIDSFINSQLSRTNIYYENIRSGIRNNVRNGNYISFDDNKQLFSSQEQLTIESERYFNSRYNVNIDNLSNNNILEELAELRNQIEITEDPKEKLLLQATEQLYIDEANTILNARESDITDYAIMSNEITNNAFREFAEGLSSPAANNNRLRALYDNYKNSKNVYLDRIEAPEDQRAMFPQAFTNEIVTNLNGLENVDEKINLLERYTGFMDEEERFQFIRELQMHEDMPYGIVVAYNLPDNLPNRQQAFNDLAISSSMDLEATLVNIQGRYAGETRNTETELTKSIIQATPDYLNAYNSLDDPNLSDIYNRKRDEAVRLTAYYMNKGMARNQAINRSVDIVFNEVIVDDLARYPADINLSEDDIMSVYENIQDVDNLARLNINVTSAYLESNIDQPREEYLDDISRNGRFINNDSGTGVKLALENVNLPGVFIEVTDENYQPIEFTFSQIKEMFSNPNAIATYMRPQSVTELM